MKAPVRRVWSRATAAADGDGFVIMLDTQPLRLPGGTRLRIGSPALADVVAAEWDRAGTGTSGVIAPDALPMTRLAATLQERVSPDREAVVASLLGYVEGELLCYRATHPVELRARQQAEWQPWLHWCAVRYGIQLGVTEGVMPVSQPEEARMAMARVLTAQEDAVLTGLGVLVPILGSLVLALALAEGVLSPPDAIRLALLDELDQASRWGADREAEARHGLLGQEVEDAVRFIALSDREQDGGNSGMAEPVARHWLVDGRVQGVGYRVWLQAEARAAGVEGWVRNLSDGRVEALLRGSPEALDRLEAAARRGPEQARVQQVVATSWPHGVPGGRFRQAADATMPEHGAIRQAVSGPDDT